MKRLLLIGFLIVLCSQGSLLPARGEEVTRRIPAWPFLYHRADPDHAETDFLWPLVRYEREKTRTRYALRPFLFSTESDPVREYHQTSVLWPLNIYTRSGPELSFHLFPIYWYGKSPLRRYQAVVPFYWEGEGTGYSFFHLWPLFGVAHRESSTEYSTLYPLFQHRHDPSSDETNIDAPWPLVNVHTTRDYVSHRFLPLYWYERGAGYAGGFLFPYYWRTTPSLTSRGIVPVWYSSRGADSATDLVFPVYFRHETPRESLRFITPLYVRRETEESRLHAVLPLYLSYIKDDTEGVQVGLPVYLQYWRGPFSFTSFFPLYYHSEDKERRTAFTYYFPLYGSYQRGETISRHFLFFPLYSSLEDKELQVKAWDLLWPLFHYERSPDTLSVRALPLYLHTRTPQYDLSAGFPLFWSFSSGENSYWHLLPLYGVHTKGDWYTKRFVLGPLFIDTHDAHAGLSRQDLLFPLFSRIQERDELRSWLIPFYYHRRTPLQRFTLGSLAFLPPYYIHRDEERRQVFHIWPFYGQERSGSYQEYSTLWPLLRFGHDPENETRLSNVLLFHYKREKDRVSTTLFPLWWHSEAPGMTRDASLFLHWYARDEKQEETRTAVLWLIPPDLSLIHYRHDPRGREHRVFPLYSYERNDRTDALRWSLLWPTFSYRSQGELIRETSVLWKVISYERQDSATSDFRLLWRVVRRSTTKNATTFELNPLYYYETERGKGSYWAILGGLVGMETREDQSTQMQLLWFF